MTVPDPSIDCTIPCFQLLKMFNSCPKREINFLNPFNSKDIYELLMVSLSVSPYPTSFLLLITGTYYRTTRSIFVLMMIFLQNFLVEILKNNLKDPRPNFKCNQHYGNPSNHASFFTCLITWFIMEYFSLERRFRWKHVTVLWCLFAVYPFIIYSRVYLGYHSLEQVINGIILGLFVGVAWFVISVNYVLVSDNPIRRIAGRFILKNTLTRDVLNDEEKNSFEEKEELNKKYQMLLEKNSQLSKLKSDLRQLTNNVKSMDFMKKDMMNEAKMKQMEMTRNDKAQEDDIEEEEEEESDGEKIKGKDKNTSFNQNRKSKEQDELSNN